MHCSWEALQCGAEEWLVVGVVSWSVRWTDLGAYNFFCDQFLSQRELHYLTWIAPTGVCGQTSMCAVGTLRGWGLCSETEREIIWLGRQELFVGVRNSKKAFPGWLLHSVPSITGSEMFSVTKSHGFFRFRITSFLRCWRRLASELPVPSGVNVMS